MKVREEILYSYELNIFVIHNLYCNTVEWDWFQLHKVQAYFGRDKDPFKCANDWEKIGTL